MAEERCEVKMGEPVDGITRKMKDQIQCRRKPHPGQTDAEKWEQIYKILFPNEVVPDPCMLDSVFALLPRKIYSSPRSALLILSRFRASARPRHAQAAVSRLC
jgi:hypothetical protein